MTEWRTVHLTQARQVAALMDVAAGDLPAPEIPLRAHYDGLRATDANAALDFIAHALPRLEAIHWAAALVTEAPVPEAHPEHAGLRDTIRDWLDSPDDALRRKIRDLAQRLDRTSPIRTLASAIFYSGGSIAPLDTPPVLPAAGLANRLAATAVLQAAYRSDDAGAFLARALSQAEAIAEQSADRRASA